MKKILLLLFLAECFCMNLAAQSGCQNIDFETGDLTEWSTQGNIKIVNRSQTDPYGHFPLASSGFFSVKLGNTETPVPSVIKRSITIDNSTKYFIYSYAVVLLGIDHTEPEAANVELKITNSAGDIVPCTYFVAFARPLVNDGFLQSDIYYMNLPVFYKSWTTNAIDLSPYIGQTLNFEIVNKWCVYDIHFGYSYIDAYCSSQFINTYTSCEDQQHYIRSIEGFEEYIWNGPGIVSGDGTHLVGVNQPGLYTVDIPNPDPTCDSVHLEISVTMNELPDIPHVDFTWSTFCLGDTATLYGQTASFSPIEEQTWIVNGTDTLEGVMEQFALNGIDQYTITCQVTNASGCSAELTKTLTVRELPLVYLGDDRKMCPGESVKLQDLSGSNVSLTWSTGDKGPFLEVNEPGNYFVHAYDGYCVNTDSVVVGMGGVNLGPVPNIITPNNDLMNDELIIESANLIDYHFFVTNRWGNLLFDTDNPTVFWDGKSNGNLVDDGVYYYVLKYVCEGVKFKKSGFIQVQK